MAKKVSLNKLELRRTQYLGNAKRQRYWASLAMRDSKYATTQSKRLQKTNHFIAAKDFKREAEVGESWANTRRGWADDYEKKANSINVKASNRARGYERRI